MSEKKIRFITDEERFARDPRGLERVTMTQLGGVLITEKTVEVKPTEEVDVREE